MRNGQINHFTHEPIHAYPRKFLLIILYTYVQYLQLFLKKACYNYFDSMTIKEAIKSVVIIKYWLTVLHNEFTKECLKCIEFFFQIANGRASLLRKHAVEKRDIFMIKMNKKYFEQITF